MRLQVSPSTGGDVRQVDELPPPVEPGTLMHKAIPPRMVEPYLTGRRSIISGFVHRVADSVFTFPGDFYQAFGLGYQGSDFSQDMAEVYVLRWRAVGSQAYQVPLSPGNGGDWTMKPPFTGTGYTSDAGRPVAEYYTEPIPVPVGAEIHRVTANGSDFIARYDGQVWLRPAEGSELCVTG
jgi:hypothetical protein